MDDMLVDNTLMFQIFFWILILALGVLAYSLPMWFLGIVGILTVVYVYIVRIYIRTSSPPPVIGRPTIGPTAGNGTFTPGSPPPVVGTPTI